MRPFVALNSLAAVAKRSTLWSSASLSAQRTRFLSSASGAAEIKTAFLMDERYVTPAGVELGVCTSRMGHLSESSVLAKAGGSVVHVAVNSGAPSEAVTEDFLPLTVDYRARFSAFGKINNDRKRKEKHGSDEEILVARFIDRAVRPLFPKGYTDEVQLLVTNHAADGVHDPTVLAVNGASLALLRSKQPWFGPIGCVRVGVVEGELKVNPSAKEMEKSPLDLLYAGTASRAVMVEAGAHQLPDEQMKSALSLAHSAVQEIIATQLQAVAADTHTAKKQPLRINAELLQSLKNKHWEAAVQLYRNNVEQKEGRSEQEGKFRAELLAEVESEQKNNNRWPAESSLSLAMAVDSLMHSAFRAAILDPHAPSPVSEEAIVRSDGRRTLELRRIQSEIDVLPSVHGSAYFGRGDTHVICSTTLGSFEDARPSLALNGLGVEKRDFFVLHYDFPPYCTGELGNATQTSRRAVGHGNLAEKAVQPVLPSFEDFPYTIKVHSECVSSNGSSSMASACGATLALMSAGVPLKAPVAGVSVGLITEDSFARFTAPAEAAAKAANSSDASDVDGRYLLLKDILGSEDHHGDMDFKVAGSATGITAIQLDVKLAGGVPLPLLFQGMDIARAGRLEILDRMLSPHQSTLAQAKLKPHAPRAELIKFNPERKSSLIGPNGEMLKFIEDLYNVRVNIVNKDSWQHMTQNYAPHGEHTPSPSSLVSTQIFDDEIGVAYLYGDNARYVREARSLVQDIAVTVKEGDVLMGEIVDVKDFGAVVQINRGQQALLRVSDLSHDPAVVNKPIEELLIKGHRLQLQITSVDTASGVVKVSRKALLDAKTSVPDNFQLLPPILSVAENENATTEDALLELSAKFPTTPPRPWNREFFKTNVAYERDIKIAMDAQHGIKPPVSKEKNRERERERETEKERDRKNSDNGDNGRDKRFPRRQSNGPAESSKQNEKEVSSSVREAAAADVTAVLDGTKTENSETEANVARHRHRHQRASNEPHANVRKFSRDRDRDRRSHSDDKKKNFSEKNDRKKPEVREERKPRRNNDKAEKTARDEKTPSASPAAPPAEVAAPSPATTSTPSE